MKFTDITNQMPWNQTGFLFSRCATKIYLNDKNSPLEDIYMHLPAFLGKGKHSING